MEFLPGTYQFKFNGYQTTITVTAGTETNYVTQFQVSFAVAPPGAGSTNPSGYYDAGPLAISATANTGYTFSSWTATTTSGTITIDNPSLASTTATINGTGTVTATFTQIEYTLTVTTVGSGSVAQVPDQATYHYGDSVELTANPVAGWSFSVWSGDISGSVNPRSIIINGTTTVTATFTQNAPKLALEKTVVNDNGGELKVGGFPLFIDGKPAVSGMQYEVTANQVHTASETQQTGYTASVWGGDCKADGTIMLLPGENKVCTITNDDIAPQLEIVKIAAGGDATFGFTVTGPAPSLSVSIKTSGGTGTTGFFPVAAGIYTVTESSMPSGWVLEGGSCSLEGGTDTFSPTAFTLPLGGKVTCTFRDENPAGLRPTVKSKTIFGNELSGVRVKVEWRESGHRRRTTIATPSSLDLPPGLYKFTAPSTVRVGGVQYRFAHWEDETGAILSGSRSLSYNVQSGKTLYAVYGPRQYRLTVEVRNATGARVPGATVEVTQLGQTYVAVTNSRGRAVIGGIYAGQPFNLKIIINGIVRYEATLTITKNTTHRAYTT